MQFYLNREEVDVAVNGSARKSDSDAVISRLVASGRIKNESPIFGTGGIHEFEHIPKRITTF